MIRIPFLRPNIVKKEEYLDYFSQIEESRIYSNYGPLNTLFENRVLKEYFNDFGSVTSVNNATIGLMLAISQSKRPKGRYALMPSFTFAATPLAAMWSGLEPYFVDIQPSDWCMNKELLSGVIDELGDKVAVVVPYATFGTDLDISYYRQLQESGIPVVIDAAASFGTFNEDGQFGKNFPGVVVYSLHATKSFGIGEGGLLYSSNAETIKRIRMAGNFGFSANRETTLLGLNSKLDEYSAAIALATLDSFLEKIDVRQRIYQSYLEEFTDRFTGNDWIFQQIRGRIPHQFLPVLCPVGKSNMFYVEKLANVQIQARTYFSPACHQQMFFENFPRTSMSITEDISNRILSLPLWEELPRSEIKQIVLGLCQ